MAINVVCSACLRRLTFKHAESGLSRKCPGCGAELTVPGEPVPVVGGKPPRSEYDIRKMEFIIAGFILVAALLGAWFFVKWYQKNQIARTPSGASRSTQSQTGATAKKIITPPVVHPVAKPISALLKSHEEIKLGPALAAVLSLTSVNETPIHKTGPAAGKTFAVVGLELKSVDPSGLFDTYQLFLLTPDGVEHGTVGIVGTDNKGVVSEVPRRRVNSTEIAGGTMKLDLYFLVPVDPATGKPNLDVLGLQYN